MKATGIIRKVDELGRIVLPIELRRNLDIVEGDPIEIFTEGEQIILQKYGARCCICGNAEIDHSRLVGSKQICKSCIDKIKSFK
jgi:transcriptional pleiotropic regulator of transition state genes